MAAPPLPSLLLLAAVLLGILLLALIVSVLVYAQRARRGAAAPAPAPPVRPRGELRQALLGGTSDRQHDAPWVMLVGFAGSGTATLATGLAMPGAAAPDTAIDGLRLRTCRGGFILEAPEELLTAGEPLSRWRGLVQALALERPERPLDGLVVALAVSDLVGPAALAPAELARRGELLHELAWALERITGFRVPLHLALTQAETLSGFGALVELLPDAARDGLIGMPDALGADAPLAEQLAGALQTLGLKLGALQLPLLLQPPAAELIDGLVVLPLEVERLAAPLATVLAPVLAPSGHHDAILFRGCYLIGPTVDGVAAFGRGLFERKVFVERWLAEPARGALGLRRRKIRLAQATLAALALLGCLGLARVAQQGGEIESVRLLLSTVDREVARLRPGPGETSATAADDVRAVAAGNLLARMSDVSISSTETLLAPTSLVSRADLHIERAIAVGYDLIVLRALHARLAARPGEIAQGLAATGNDRPVPAALTAVRGLREYEANLRRYERLVERDVPALAGLADYALGIRVAPQFFRHYELYRGALADSAPPALDRAMLGAEVEATLLRRWPALVAAHLHASPAARAMEALAAAEQANDRTAIERLRRIVIGLDALARTLERPDAAWLVPSTGRLDAELEGLLLEVGELALAWGPPLDPRRTVAQLRETALDVQSAERERLVERSLFGVTPALVAGDGAVGLAVPLARARDGLAAFLDQPLLRDRHVALPARVIRPDERLIWDVPVLRELLAAAEGKLVVDSRDLADLPPELARLAREAAAPSLRALADIAVARAQTSDPSQDWSRDRGLEREARALAAAAPLLTALGQTLELAGLADRAAALRAMVEAQARRLLAETDRALERAAPYAMLDPTLGSWDGQRPLRLAAFGAGSAAELAASLPGRRGFVERLAEDYAAPLLGLLTQPGVALDAEDRDRVERWRETLAALDRYRRNDPTSSLLQLERLLTSGLDAVGPDSCGDHEAGTAIAWDYFAQQRYLIQDAVVARCARLAGELASSRYEALARAFNETLAGRFPFVAVGPAATGAPQAEADEVRRFFRSFDAELRALPALLAAGLPPPMTASARAFLDDLGSARSVLAPMIDPPVAAPLTYELAVDFRAEPSRERGGNQVIEWLVETASGRLSSLESVPTLSWAMGEPVRVALRWARNGPSLPMAGADGRPRVAGPVASFDYRDPWALLTLVQAHRSVAGVAGTTLRFEVPLTVNPDAAPGGPAGLDRAELFLRLRLTAVVSLPGEPARRIPLPGLRFPVAAPELSAAVTAAPDWPSWLTLRPGAGR